MFLSQNNNKQRTQKALGDEEYVYYLECGSGNMSVYICWTDQIVHINYVKFLYANYAFINLGGGEKKTNKVIWLAEVLFPVTY